MFQDNPGLDTEDVGLRPQTTQEHLKNEGQMASGFTGDSGARPTGQASPREREGPMPQTPEGNQPASSSSSKLLTSHISYRSLHGSNPP